jgi:hypothetical protein
MVPLALKPDERGASIQQRDAVAVGGQRTGGGFADPRRGAGDDRDAAGVGLSSVLMRISRGWSFEVWDAVRGRRLGFFGCCVARAIRPVGQRR